MTSPSHISGSRLALSVALIAATFSAGCRKYEESSARESLPNATVRVVAVEQKARLSSEEVVGVTALSRGNEASSASYHFFLPTLPQAWGTMPYEKRAVSPAIRGLVHGQPGG